MGYSTPRSASAIISSVEVLAQYAALHGITEAQDALMDILASVHGWSTDLPEPSVEEELRKGFSSPSPPSGWAAPRPPR